LGKGIFCLARISSSATRNGLPGADFHFIQTALDAAQGSHQIV
jgi:hypothetical protein